MWFRVYLVNSMFIFKNCVQEETIYIYIYIYIYTHTHTHTSEEFSDIFASSKIYEQLMQYFTDTSSNIDI